MKVLVFEPKFVGHFIGFSVAAANAFARIGCDVALALSEAAQETPQAEVKLKGALPGVKACFPYHMPKIYDRWKNARLEADALATCLDKLEFDHLVVPSADFLLCGLLLDGALRRRIKRTGADFILHNCEQAYPDLGIRKGMQAVLNRLAVTVARGIQLHTVDAYAVSPSAAHGMGLGRNTVKSLPHFFQRPTEAKDQMSARRALGLPTDGCLLGSIGDLGRRKGTEIFIEAFAAADLPADARLALFGVTSGSVKATLKKHQHLIDAGRILVEDRFVTDDEFDEFFFAVDVVWAGYPRQIGMASVLLYAAGAHRAALASDYGNIGWSAHRYGLGPVFRVDLPGATDAIERFVRGESKYPDPNGVERFLRYHTTQHFEQALTAAVRGRREATAPSAVGSAKLVGELT